MRSNIVTIKAYKYGNIKHYQWPVKVIEKNNDFLICKGEPGRILKHFTRNKEFVFEKPSIEYFSFRDWFTLAMNIDGQKIESYYCNISKPVVWEKERVFSFIDLDLDLVKNKGEGWKVVDEDEFEVNSKKYNYPKELINRAKKELDDLSSKIENRVYPFDGSLLKYI